MPVVEEQVYQIEGSDAVTYDRDGNALLPGKICEFIQRVDYVHISTSSSKRAAQSHGNWANSTCDYALADVTTQIDKKNLFWLHAAVGEQGKGRLGPNPKGLGRGARVTAHYDCNGTGSSNYRSWTDVDIVGYADTPNRVYSTPVDLDCG
ncbi:hypothetical protein EDF22_3618 [Rathayibacter sp. PhB127]|uniref:hypothetical protein n=1 Tax=Rathayibacter sp. PhB127 TaxID=2485176 RepID=UPI000FB9BA15|nr:hypothetical protein [Rathayibacter sp. PhB127]ROS22112.1 hypothetical protein EDF22_3618 [Rathayibacter sp. PhB127]